MTQPDIDPAAFMAQVEALRPELLRFAQSRVANDAWAEDAVSETLLAAMEKPASFGGRSRLKTWLIAILKFKLVDQMRHHSREATVLVDEDGEDLEDLLFSADGHWRQMPAHWGDGCAALEQREFFEVLEMCHELLPSLQARVFMMREWLELDTEQICTDLAITPANLWVLLHRARLRLRGCLEQRWFQRTPVLTP